MDTSTLLVVFLLVTAATLASYALSHWNSIRGVIGVATASIGTTMLLVAAAIVVLTFVFRGPLWRPNLGTEQELREAAAAAKETSRRLAASPFAAAASAAGNETSARTVGQRESPAGGSPVLPVRKEQTSKPAATQTAEPGKSTRSSQPVSAFTDADPWAATRCVYASNRDLSMRQRKIDNDCDTPVGVVVGGRSIILPLPAQRPISLDERTIDFDTYTACFVSTAEAIDLIGASSEERSTAQWRHQFDQARLKDGCLTRLPGYGSSVP